MKKFFALMLVVAMLSVAGSAMAVTVTVSGDNATVALYAGETATATVLVSADYPTTGVITSVDLSTAATWITSSDVVSSGDNYCTMTLTFKPGSGLAAGTYTAVVSAYETYISGDLVGHTPSYTVSDSVKISVKVLAETEKAEIVENVPVISASIATMATIVQVKDTQTTVNQLVGEAKTSVANALSNILSAVGITVDLNTPVLGGTNVETGRSENWVDGDDAANLTIAAARLKQVAGENALVRAAGAVPPLRAIANAFQAIGLPQFASIFYNQHIEMDLGETGDAVPGSFFAAAATGTNQVVFLNSLGQQVTVVPDGTHGETAGKVTAVAYVEGGKTYEPLLFVRFPSKASMDSFDSVAGTTVVKEVTIVVTSDDQPTPPVPVDSGDIFPAGKNFTVHVGAANKAALASFTGLSLDEIPVTTVSSDQTRSGDLYIGTTYVEEVALIPRLQNLPASAAGHGYVAAFKYDKLVNSRTIISSPLFIPDWTNGNAAGGVYAITGTTTKVARDALSGDVYTGNTGYLVFRVSGDTIAFSAAAASFADPRLVAASATTTPSTDYPEGTSSSSGGCSAGSAALALAVLGSFILTRKK